MRRLCLTIAGVLAFASATPAYAQAGVCNRASDDTRDRVNRDVDGWIAAINATNLPPHVKNAHIVLFEYNRAQSMQGIEGARLECTEHFRPYQEVVDIMVVIYTAGLSRILQPHMTHVDVSELLAGYPLGGPDALVPRFREQILNGDRGTIANILRDPLACLTFRRRC